MTDHAISRRHLLAASGAGSAALVLSACGAAATGDPEETEPEREAEVLNELLAAQTALNASVNMAPRNAQPGSLRPVFDGINQRSSRAISEMDAAVTELGGEPNRPVENLDLAVAESPVEAVAAQLDATITASLDALPEITTAAYRQQVHRSITEDAAFRAAIADTLGEDLAPSAFAGATT